MIDLCRSEARQHDQRRRYDLWLTFAAGSQRPAFGALIGLDEATLRPGYGVSARASENVEVITYVHEGTVSAADATGRTNVLLSGEFQRSALMTRDRSTLTNVGTSGPANVLQLRLRAPAPSLRSGTQQLRFSAADRRGQWCVIASPDARNGSLRLQRDAVLFSAVLGPGQHVVHALAAGHSAWLHVVQGEATLGDLVLTTGDGAALRDERSVSLTVREPTELLLLDLADTAPPRSTTDEGVRS